MPRLYSIKDDFSRNDPKFLPSHFFYSARFINHHNNRLAGWEFDLNKDFPTQSYIHSDMHMNGNSFWIPLRKAVERDYTGDVFYVYESKNYKRWYNENAEFDFLKRTYDVVHGYWTFYFEEPSDQTMFILHYGELLSPKKYRFHPLHGVSCIDARYDVPEDEIIEQFY